MEELIARSSLVIALYGRSGSSSCGHGDYAAILDALLAREQDRLSALMIRHIDHLEADLDLRSSAGVGLRDAILPE